MIRLIEGSVASFYPREMAAMHRNRFDVFVKRLKWVDPDPKLERDGTEIDKFDDANPLYLVSLDPETEDYQGSLRLLPTTGPNMLRDVPQFCPLSDTIVESATIWESSRIIGATPRIMAELVIGIGEVALKAGLTAIVSVFEDKLYRLLTILGCRIDLLGEPQIIGTASCMAGWFPVNEEHVAELKRRAKVRGSVLDPDHTRFVTRLLPPGEEGRP